MTPPDTYIWANRWEDFQTFQEKRGKPWAPPWIRLYPRLLDDPNFLALTPRRRMILVGIWLLLARTRLTLGSSPAQLGRMLNDLSVRQRDLDALNHAGFISFCSGTVLEQRQAAFWNGSTLEVEVDIEPKAVPLTSYDTNSNGNGLGSEISKSKSSIYPTHEVPF